jgi:hypothetical protein
MIGKPANSLSNDDLQGYEFRKWKPIEQNDVPHIAVFSEIAACIWSEYGKTSVFQESQREAYRVGHGV